MWKLDPQLRGDIVNLEPLGPEHRDALLAASRSPEIWAWWPIDVGRDEQAFHGWFDEALRAGRAGEEGHFATVDAVTGTPLGSTSLCTPRPEDRGIEIGWTWLTPAAWGTGANVEAKLLQLGYAFDQLECIRVEFETDELNQRSRRALEALPARFEGVLRDWRILPGGRRASSAFYSILEREWPAVRENLTRRVAAHRTAA